MRNRGEKAVEELERWIFSIVVTPPSTKAIARLYLEVIKFIPTEKQSNAIAELGFLPEILLSKNENLRKSHPLGFVFSDTIGTACSGDRYLGNGRVPTQVFRIRPNGTYEKVDSLPVKVFI